jgi:hypothetical protein
LRELGGGTKATVIDNGDSRALSRADGALIYYASRLFTLV